MELRRAICALLKDSFCSFFQQNVSFFFMNLISSWSNCAGEGRKDLKKFRSAKELGDVFFGSGIEIVPYHCCVLVRRLDPVGVKGVSKEL